MSDLRNFQDLLQQGPEAIFDPASRRVEIGRLYPTYVAQDLAKAPSPLERKEWTTKLTQEHWVKLQRERGNAWERGWPELIAGLVTALELLYGELPPAIREEVNGTPAEAIWRNVRRGYQRFILTVQPQQVQAHRVFTEGTRSPEQGRIEQVLTWSHDGPTFSGRSHTLMLGLAAREMLPDDLGPVAATGELAEHWRTVLPVEALAEKAQGWFKAFPQGTLLSAPPREEDLAAWMELVRQRRGILGEEDGELQDHWICGASLAELRAKLQPPAPIKGWDGLPLRQRATVELTLSAEPSLPGQDAFLSAALQAHEAARAGVGARGVLVQGEPGSGKSIWSQAVVRRLRRGLPGSLGYGVRRSARSLCMLLESDNQRGWAGLLAEDHSGEEYLYSELERTRRLVPIIDGIDELNLAEVDLLSRLLERAPGWWIVTSRPVEAICSRLPPTATLTIDDLNDEQRREVLLGLDREDLADQLSSGIHATSSGVESSLALLIRTPLLLTLLAKVVARGEQVGKLELHELYQRTFQGLLEKAEQDQRLNAREARLVKSLMGSVVGELALEALNAPGGRIDLTAVNRCMRKAQIRSPIAQEQALHILEFGYLLAPEAGSWIFSHRTLAEWAAAGGLRQRVDEALEQLRQPTASAEAHATIEWEVVEPYFSTPLLRHQSANQQLLRFYAPHAVAPLGLLLKLVGPESREQWRSTEVPSWVDDPRQGGTRPARVEEVIEEWRFCLDLAADARWPWPDQARQAWAMLVRFYQLCQEPRLGDKELASARRFTRKMAPHLPYSLDELVALAAISPKQKKQVQQRPQLLLPFLPSAMYSMLKPLLQGDDPRQQLALLGWCSSNGVEVDNKLLGSLLQATARQVRAAPSDALEDARRLIVNPLPDDLGSPSDELKVVLQVQDAVWDVALGQGLSIPWDMVRSRIERQGYKLDQQLMGWFSCTPTATVFGSRDPDGIKQRQQALGLLLEYSDLTTEAIKCLAPDQLDSVAGALWASLHPDAPERDMLLASVIKAGRLPNQIPVEVVLSSDKSDWRYSDLKLTERHMLALKETACSAADEIRYRAICLLAQIQQQDKCTALLAHLPTADLALRQRISEWTLRCGSLDACQVPDIPAEILAVLPLPFQAALGHPAWEQDLVQRLEKGDLEQPGADLPWLVRLVREYRITAALPHLLQYLGPYTYSAREILITVARVAGDTDQAIARQALQEALSRGWDGTPHIDWKTNKAEKSPWAPLLRFLSVENLEWVIRGKVSALEWAEVREALVRLGPQVVPLLRSRHREIQEQLGQLHKERECTLAADSTSGDEQAKAESEEVLKTKAELKDILASLAETIVSLMDASQTTIPELVQLAFEVAGGDVISVYGSPGVLGSDFNEPEDQDWDSTQKNETLIKALTGLLEHRLQTAPEEWPDLHSLFRHPSASLIKAAFQLAAARAPAYEVSQLALDALEMHAQYCKTRLTGNVGQFRLVMASGTSGEMDVQLPNTAQVLIRAVRNQLTAAHKPLVLALGKHTMAQFRHLAGQWAGELGNASWTPLLAPLLEDKIPEVVAQAALSIRRLAPDTLDRVIMSANREAWGRDHYGYLLQALLERKVQSGSRRTTVPEPLIQAGSLGSESRRQLLKEAANLETLPEREPNQGRSIFQGFPSIAEHYLGPLLEVPQEVPALTDLLKQWTGHTHTTIRAVSRRLEARLGVMDSASLQVLISGNNGADHFSALECLTFMGGQEQQNELMDAWVEYLRPTRYPLTETERNRYYPEYGEERLFWALQGAPPSFAPLLGLVLEHVETTTSMHEEIPAGVTLVRQTAALMSCWGDPGLRWLVRLMDTQQVNPYCYELKQLAVQRALEEVSFKVLLEKAAKEGGEAAADICETVMAYEASPSLDGFMEQLKLEVFAPPCSSTLD